MPDHVRGNHGSVRCVGDLVRLGDRLATDVLEPGHVAFEQARRVYNGRIDRIPRFIVRCASAEDVAETVRFARESGLPLAIRSGGHSAPGFGVCDGGVVADLRSMNRVEIDTARGVVAVGGGCLWGEVDSVTTPRGVATTAARISTVGVAGSTLGGGYGWLMRRYGLAIDNLVAADVVLAEGRQVRADRDTNADLFWALRGGGGNFGAVTTLEFRLHELPEAVTAGMVFYPAGQAADVLAVFRDITANASDDLCAQCNVLIAPPAPFVPPGILGRPIIAVAVCHLAQAQQAERDVAPLRALRPVVDRIRPMPYARLQRLFDAAGTFGRCTFGRSGHLPELSDTVMSIVLEHAFAITSPFSIAMISAVGGAVSRVGSEATAFGHRQTAYDCAIDAVWTDAADSARHIDWTERFWGALRPYTSGVYVNELGDEGPSRVREAYESSSWARLVAVKQQFDPDNVFRLNHNIAPDADLEEGTCSPRT